MSKLLIQFVLIIFTASVVLAADKNVFVNTDCTFSGTGSSASCAVSGGATGAWKTCPLMVTGETLLNANLTTLGGNIIVNFSGATVDSQCIIDGFTGMDASHVLRLVGNLAGTTWDATKYHISDSQNGTGTIDVRDPYVEFDKMQIEETGTGTGIYVALNYANAGGALYGKVTNSIIRGADCNEGGGGTCLTFNFNPEVANSKLIAHNNFIYGPTTQNADLRGAGNGGNGEILIFYNNTMYGGAKGVSTHGGGSSDSQYIKNNVANNNSTAGFSLNESGAHTTDVHSNNISGDASSPDSSLRSKNCTFTNTGSGTENFSLTSGDTNCKDAGVSLVSDSDAQDSFSVDIVGTTRPQGSAWDIGGFEYITAVLNGSLTTMKVSGTH